MRNSPNLSFSLNVVLKRIKLHSVHSALDVERFRDHGFVFQNSNEPVPKCSCSPLMPVFILRVPLILSVFAFWIWLGIRLSFPLPFRILTPKHWGPLAYLDAPNFYNFDAIVIDERWPDDSCPADLILTKRKLRWPTNRNFVMPFARVHSSSAVLLFFKNLFNQSKARIKKYFNVIGYLFAAKLS